MKIFAAVIILAASVAPVGGEFQNHGAMSV